MSALDVSVIIPTRDRRDSLQKCLARFSRQTHPKDRFEVVVIDDGSRDGTRPFLEEVSGKLPYPLRSIFQGHAGPAAARNKGVQAAQGDILLFTGDDIFSDERFLEKHLAAHRRHPGGAVLGFVEWSSDLAVTDFMRLIAPNGFQFRYDSIEDKRDCGYRHFYTSNISMGREWFKNDLFDEEFPFPALEDTEFGYRLEKRGLKIIFEESAVGYHHHPVSYESFCRRMKQVGISASTLLRKHPELKSDFLPGGPLLATALHRGLSLSTFLLPIFGRKVAWKLGIIRSYLEGVRQGA